MKATEPVAPVRLVTFTFVVPEAPGLNGAGEVPLGALSLKSPGAPGLPYVAFKVVCGTGFDEPSVNWSQNDGHGDSMPMVRKVDPTVV